MTTPHGILAWGQAGEYDAHEDRAVITALAGRSGLVTAPVLTALPGLVVGVGPWQGIVDCGDRTLGVIGSRDQQQIDVAAGGVAGRTDVLWADIDPDAGTWAGALYPAGQEVGRLGVLLATIVVPAGASTSGAMDLIPGAVEGGGAGGPKGLVAYARQVDTNHGRTANSFGTAVRLTPCNRVRTEAGRLYRLQFIAYAARLVASQPPASAAISCAFDRNAAQLGQPMIFRYPPNVANLAQHIGATWTGPLPAGTSDFGTRAWCGGGSYNLDPTEAGITLTIEDIGPLE